MPSINENSGYHPFAGTEGTVSLRLQERRIEDPLVIAWIGRVTRNSNPKLHSLNLIDVFAAPAPFLSGRNLSQGFPISFPGNSELGNPERWVHFSDGVDRLPFYRLGYVYQHGRLVGALEPQEREVRVSITSANAGIVSAADSDGVVLGGQKSYRIPFERYRVPDDAMPTQLLLASTGEGAHMLIPWWEIARYFFAGTSSMLHLIFSGLARNWPSWICNCERTKWIDKEKGFIELWLRQRVPDADLLIAALIWHCPRYRTAACRPGNSLDGKYKEGGFPAMTWPIENGHLLRCRGIPMVSRAGNRHFLVTEILGDDTALPFTKITLWRDNDGRKGRILVPFPRAAGWSRRGGGLRTESPPSDTPINSTDVPTSKRGPERITHSLQCSAFTDPLKMTYEKPEKELQTTVSVPRADPHADWEGEASTSLQGSLDGELRRAIISGFGKSRKDPSKLSTKENAKRTVEDVIALLRKKNIQGVQSSFKDISLAIRLDDFLNARERPNNHTLRWLLPDGEFGGSRHVFLWEIAIETSSGTRHFVVIEIERWTKSEAYYLVCVHQKNHSSIGERELDGVLKLCVARCGCWSKRNGFLPPGLKLIKFRHSEPSEKRARLDKRLFAHIASECRKDKAPCEGTQ